MQNKAALYENSREKFVRVSLGRSFGDVCCGGFLRFRCRFDRSNHFVHQLFVEYLMKITNNTWQICDGCNLQIRLSVFVYEKGTLLLVQCN